LKRSTNSHVMLSKELRREDRGREVTYGTCDRGDKVLVPRC